LILGDSENRRYEVRSLPSKTLGFFLGSSSKERLGLMTFGVLKVFLAELLETSELLK